MRLLWAMIAGALLFPGPGLAQSTSPSGREPDWSKGPAHAWPQPAPLPEDTVRINPIRPTAYQSPSPEKSPQKEPTPEPQRPEPAASRAEHSSDSLASHATGLPLRPPSHRAEASASQHGEADQESKPAQSNTSSLTTVGASLVLVTGLFLLVAWVLRRATPGQAPSLPKGVVEVLGRTPLAGRQQLHLLRCGNKLLLISVMPGGVEPLAEITEPAEVDRICGLCQANQPDSATAVFRNVLHQLSREPATGKRRGRASSEPDYGIPRRVRMEVDDG